MADVSWKSSEDSGKKVVRFAISLLILGIVFIGGWYLLEPSFFKQQQINTSDAQNVSENLRIGGDDYHGYWFITSNEMKKQCLNQGIGITYTNDGGAYADRLKKFSNGDYDCIILPINSWLEHGAAHKFPGVIVAAICESKGADGICGYVSSGSVNDLNNANLKFVYTAASPSEFLLHLTSADFNFDQLKDNKGWAVEVNGVEDVLEKAKKREGDVFILWEPLLTEALSLKGMKYIWGSDKFKGYIIDVFVFNRKVIDKKPALVQNFLKSYFRTLDIYTNNREQMIKEMKSSTGKSKDQIETMLKKIDWFDLQENAESQFGIAPPGKTATEGIFETISSCTKVMLRQKTISTDPLNGNYLLIMNSSFVKDLIKTRVAAPIAKTGLRPTFNELSDADWHQLHEAGTMGVEPITFQTGNNMLDDDGKVKVDDFAKKLINNYPTYRLIVRGHTGPGDETENVKLSTERSQVIVQRLIAVHHIDQNRVRAEGAGSQMPPPMKDGESQREYRYRLSRVEFILVEPNPL
jgi:outer membrane protein OmpA-like peptidoglycan-associated protein